MSHADGKQSTGDEWILIFIIMLLQPQSLMSVRASHWVRKENRVRENICLATHCHWPEYHKHKLQNSFQEREQVFYETSIIQQQTLNLFNMVLKLNMRIFKHSVLLTTIMQAFVVVFHDQSHCVKVWFCLTGDFQVLHLISTFQRSLSPNLSDQLLI